jgi:hypothetical protein
VLNRALQYSTKICLQIDDEGFMSIQVMMPVGEDVPIGEHSGILEFKVGRVLVMGGCEAKADVQMHALEEGDE